MNINRNREFEIELKESDYQTLLTILFDEILSNDAAGSCLRELAAGQNIDLPEYFSIAETVWTTKNGFTLLCQAKD